MAAEANVLDIPVEFGGVSIGDELARLGIKVSRSSLKLAQADKNLVGKRLTGWVQRTKNGEVEGQKRLPGMKDADLTLVGTFDVKRLGVSAEEISFGLAFNVRSVEVGELAQFAKRTGRLVVQGVEEIPEEEADDDEDQEEG